MKKRGGRAQSNMNSGQSVKFVFEPLRWCNQRRHTQRHEDVQMTLTCLVKRQRDVESFKIVPDDGDSVHHYNNSRGMPMLPLQSPASCDRVIVWHVIVAHWQI
jgi:hypothetical protein